MSTPAFLERAARESRASDTLVEIKEELRPEYQEIASHVLQDVISRLNKAFDRFFDRVKKGQKPGYPRFQDRNRYTSFTYPDGAGWKLDQRTRLADKKGIVRVNLRLSKIGTVKLHLHRDMEGTIKTLTIKREGEHWYAVFTCEIGTPTTLPISCEQVGVDLGITHFAALSTGEFINNPRYFRRGHKTLDKRQHQERSGDHIAGRKRCKPSRKPIAKYATNGMTSYISNPVSSSIAIK